LLLLDEEAVRVADPEVDGRLDVSQAARRGELAKLRR
jgi:hypothetical protein